MKVLNGCQTLMTSTKKLWQEFSGEVLAKSGIVFNFALKFYSF